MGSRGRGAWLGPRGTSWRACVAPLPASVRCGAVSSLAPRCCGCGRGVREVWCPATAGEPIRAGPAWGYGAAGSLLVRGVRTVSSCGRPGRDPGRACSAGGIRALVPSFPGRWPRRRMSARLTPLWPLRVRHCSCSHQDSNLDVLGGSLAHLQLSGVRGVSGLTLDALAAAPVHENLAVRGGPAIREPSSLP